MDICEENDSELLRQQVLEEEYDEASNDEQSQ